MQEKTKSITVVSSKWVSISLLALAVISLVIYVDSDERVDLFGHISVTAGSLALVHALFTWLFVVPTEKPVREDESDDGTEIQDRGG
jgi:hypothetical protein